MKYHEWISKNVPYAYGTCKEVTERMQVAFPELARVRGYYICAFWGKREHWWLKTNDGTIIDPTAAQFPTKGRGAYEELLPDAKEPTGKCPECGIYVYGIETFCCVEHAHSFVCALEGDI